MNGLHSTRRPAYAWPTAEGAAPAGVERAAGGGAERLPDYRAERLASQAERWTLTRADAVLVVSAALETHVRSLGVEPQRVHVLPNGVDPQLFHPGAPDPDLRRRLGLNGGPTLGFVGGLRPWHGIELLPDLLQRLMLRHQDIRLVVVGDGPLRQPLETELGRAA